MTNKLQITLNGSNATEVRVAATKAGLTTSEYVRRQLEKAKAK